MPDDSDPGRVERYTDRQVERVRQTVHEPNRSDILKTIRKAQRGNIPIRSSLVAVKGKLTRFNLAA